MPIFSAASSDRRLYALSTTRMEARLELAVEALSSSGRLRMRALGRSMLPALWPGDTLVIARVEASDLKPGELVMYGGREGLVVHRVVGRDGTAVMLRGDSTDVADAPVFPDEVLGRVVEIRRCGLRFAPAVELGPARRFLGFLVRRCGPFRAAVFWLSEARLTLHGVWNGH